MPDIELEPTEFRPIPQKPLASPALLWKLLALAVVATILAAFAAAHFGGFWAALLPVPCGIWLGIALAGLFPKWFFSDNT